MKFNEIPMPSPEKQVTLLTCAGLIPFYVLSFSTVLGLYLPFLPNNISAYDAYVYYGAVIASFLCGMHWGIYMLKHKVIPLNLFVISNILVLFTWFSMLVIDSNMCLIMQQMVFITLYKIDSLLAEKKIIPQWFLSLRTWVTSGVVFSALPIYIAMMIASL